MYRANRYINSLCRKIHLYKSLQIKCLYTNRGPDWCIHDPIQPNFIHSCLWAVRLLYLLDPRMQNLALSLISMRNLFIQTVRGHCSLQWRSGCSWNGRSHLRTVLLSMPVPYHLFATLLFLSPFPRNSQSSPSALA